MAIVTLRMVDGPERGRVFDQISTPITIGREEGNVVRLNDERISRFHVKIHENNGSVILTDLDSTNGTRVNGEVVQLWELKPGDLVFLGRSTILIGSRDEIASRLLNMKRNPLYGKSVPMGYLHEDIEQYKKDVEEKLLQHQFHQDDTTTGMLEEIIFQGLQPEDLEMLHSLLPPKSPEGLTPRQNAQFLEIMQYFFLRIRYLTNSVSVDPQSDNILLAAEQWQNLLDLYDRIAHYIKKTTEP